MKMHTAATGTLVVLGLMLTACSGGDAEITASHQSPNETADQAGTTQSPLEETAAEALEANERLVEAIFTSGIQLDYQPLASPQEAMAAPLVVVGQVRSARVASGDAGPEVRLVVDVTRHVAGDEHLSTVETAFNIGNGFDLAQRELDEVRGPVLLVVDNLLPQDGSDNPRLAYSHVDGAWFDVPGGIAGPYVRYDQMHDDWPQASSVVELADALTKLP